jgi:hypothetical protein
MTGMRWRYSLNFFETVRRSHCPPPTRKEHTRSDSARAGKISVPVVSIRHLLYDRDMNRPLSQAGTNDVPHGREQGLLVAPFGCARGDASTRSQRRKIAQLATWLCGYKTRWLLPALSSFLVVRQTNILPNQFFACQQGAAVMLSVIRRDRVGPSCESEHSTSAGLAARETPARLPPAAYPRGGL